MSSDSIWIIGSSRSGKTTRLVEQFCSWVQSEKEQRHKANSYAQRLYTQQKEPAVLVLAANDDNRRELADRIVAATGGKYPIRAKTPLGFFQDEVILYWPLLIQLLNLKAQFPVKLRPETEQELATLVWSKQLDEEIRPPGVSESRFVRRLLDLLQLAAYSGTPIEDIAGILATSEEGDGETRAGEAEEAGEAGGEKPIRLEKFGGTETDTANFSQNPKSKIQNSLTPSPLLIWRDWCWERGFLTYGITTELYYRHLLPDPYYQQHLTRRYQYVLADDVDDYPAIARDIFDLLLDQKAVGAFTYNSDGGVRVGLGADPNYLEKLALRCQTITLSQPTGISLASELAEQVVESVTFPSVLLSLPSCVQTLQTTSRADLLRQTADSIIEAVQSKQVQPQEIAIIAPGLDAIARYTLVEILTKQGIPVESLNDQRSLIAFPIIRALLTLLALVYPGLGRLVDRDAVAEMLVVLTRRFGEAGDNYQLPSTGAQRCAPTNYQLPIDPVRAGLIADHCFEPHPDRPNLLPVSVYDRWDRLGYAATKAYEQILEWIDTQRSQQQQRLLPSPISLLDRAIQKFLWNGSNLPYDQLAALRELLETAQHYWEVDTRLRHEHYPTSDQNEKTSPHATIAQFIQLLRRGTITANPYPVRPIGPASRALTLATIFQYRSSRRFHRWQFWLDAGSPLWLSGGAATLFGANLFLQHRFGQPWTTEEEINANEERLRRILGDLLGRVGERVYLCHSELAVNGQEQIGPLLPLVNTAIPVDSKAILT